MGRKERVEDLGRIRQMIQCILDSDLLNICDNHLNGCRAKDAIDVFFTLDREKQEDFVHDSVYSMKAVVEDLNDVLQIARGEEVDE